MGPWSPNWRPDPTGRRLAAEVAAGHDNIVVMLDGALACLELDPDGWQIWWGANLGTAEEELVAGPLAEVADLLRARRDELRRATGCRQASARVPSTCTSALAAPLPSWAARCEKPCATRCGSSRSTSSMVASGATPG